MRDTDCGKAIFPHQGLETRRAQETLKRCAGMHNKFEGTKHSLCKRKMNGRSMRKSLDLFIYLSVVLFNDASSVTKTI